MTDDEPCDFAYCNGEEHHEYDPTCNAWVPFGLCPTPAASSASAPPEASDV